MILTPRQQQVVDFLRDYAAREGMPPTQAEIASRFGFTQKAACDHLKLIAAKGVIEVRRDIPRGIRFAGRVAEKGGGTLPLVLRLRAEPPTLSAEEVDQWVPIAGSLFRPRADYLRRAGSAVPELGIHKGDLIGVKRAAAPAGRQVAVARLVGKERVVLVVGPLPRRDAAAKRGERLEVEGLYCGHFHPA
jgi:repressor LexA